MIWNVIRLVSGKNGIIGALVVLVGWAGLDAYRQRQEIKRLQTVYKNPEVKTVERVVKVEGPVRIVTRVIERPTGERETVVDETRGPVTETNEAAHETKVVAIETVMAPRRSDRILLTLGVNRLSADTDGKAVFVGYGFRNRFDLHVGGVKRDDFSPWILATLRF